MHKSPIRHTRQRLLLLAVVFMFVLGGTVSQPLTAYAESSSAEILAEAGSTKQLAEALPDADEPEAAAEDLPKTDEMIPREDVLTDEVKTELAGMILTDIMNLILDEYVGQPVTPEDLYEAALRGMTDVLDAYSEYFDDDELSQFTGSLAGRLTGIGVVLRMNTQQEPEIIRVLPDTPAQDAGLLRGDILQSVNGESVSGLTVSEIVDMILDESVERVSLRARRGSITKTFNMRKREIKSVTVYTDRIENMVSSAADLSAYRYVYLSSISSTTAEDLRAAITRMKKEGVNGVVLDMRGNSGGYLDIAVNICTQIVPKGPILHTIDSKGNKRTMYSALREQPFEKMVVLVDRDTASAAELITAALQDAGAAVVIGETTYGKGVIQTLFPLATGGGLKLTTEEYLRRSGEPINKIGVIPDIAVEMDVSDYETEHDAALLKALEWLTE